MKLNLEAYKKTQGLIGQGMVDHMTPWTEPADAGQVTAHLATDDEGKPCLPVGMGGKVHASAISAARDAAPWDGEVRPALDKLRQQISAVSFLGYGETATFAEDEAGPWLEVFRAGDYGDQKKGTWSETDLDRIVSNYEPAYHEAPVTTDHAQSGPRYGVVTALRRVGGVLEAKLGRLSAALKSAISDGSYQGRSVELYKDLDGKGPYLRALTFLGAAVPAVKGLKPVSFREGDALTFEFKDYTAAERKAMAKEGEAMADGSFPIKSRSDLSNAVRDWGRAGGAAAVKKHITARAKALGCTDLLPADWPGSTQKKEAKMADEKGTVNFEEELAKRDAQIAKLQREARLAKDGAFVDGLVAAGQLTPALRDLGVAEFCSALDEAEVVTFAEGAAAAAGQASRPEVKMSRAAWFREFLGRLPKAVEFKEAAPAEKPAGEAKATPTADKGIPVDPERADLDKKVRAFMEKNPSMGYGEALDKVTAL